MADTPPNKPVEPYIPASKSMPELAAGALILGAILAIVLAGANAYLGLFAGMTVSASVPAAVISMGIFRALRAGNILQNNGVQTAAASGEGLAAGAIFTFPALILLGEWTEFHYLETTLIALFGGILGVLFTIPLRRALIIDQPLQFPEGVATAEVLKVGAEGGGGLGVLLLTGLLGAVIKIGAAGFKLWAEIAEFGAYIGGGTAALAKGATVNSGVPAYFGINASPALLSVGYIVGFNVALVIFAGAVLNRWIAVPLFASMGDPTAIVVNQDTHGVAMSLPASFFTPESISANSAAMVGTLYEALKVSWATPEMHQMANPVQILPADQIDAILRAHVLSGPLPEHDAINAAGIYHARGTRFLGVGGMLVGGFWSLFKLRKSLLGGITAGLEAYKRARAGGDTSDIPRTERDMPMNIILILIGVSVIPLFFIFWHVTGSVGISAVMAIVMLVAGFLFSAVASYMAGLVGSSNNPVSGITISTILVAALLLLALGMDSKAGPVAAILIGSIVCCAAAIGGDNLQDLKCGQLVGSTPWKQQVMQILGVVAAAFVLAPVLNLLHTGYGIGEGLAAPQANLMGTVAKGVFAGGLPWNIIAIGAGIAVGVIIIDSIQAKRGSKFRVPVMAFAVGVYLPFDLNVPIMMGGVIALLVEKHLNKINASKERRGEVERMGLLAAAGFITGEALMGIGLAVPVAATGNAAPLALFGGEYEHLKIPSLIFVAISLMLLYKLALRPEPVGKPRT